MSELALRAARQWVGIVHKSSTIAPMITALQYANEHYRPNMLRRMAMKTALPKPFRSTDGAQIGEVIRLWYDPKKQALMGEVRMTESGMRTLAELTRPEPPPILSRK
jgi:hypothetical protein